MLDQIMEMLRKYSDTTEISPDSNLKSDLGLDSFQLVSIVVEIEDTLGVTIEESKVPDFVVVRDIAEYLDRRA